LISIHFFFLQKYFDSILHHYNFIDYYTIKAIPVSDIILEEIPKACNKMNPIATEIGNCIRIINALRKGIINIMDTTIISSIKVPLTDSIAFLSNHFDQDVLKVTPSESLNFFHFFLDRLFTLSAFSP
jgi:hypothetical protein